MFDKLKAIGVGFLAVLMLSSMITQGIATWQMNKSKEAYDQARVDMTTVSTNSEVLATLTQRLNQSELVGQTTKERFDQLEAEIRQPKEAVAPAPSVNKDAKPATRAVPAKAPPTKEAVHEDLHLPSPANSNIALRAINELWIDYCKRFPGERDCRDRGLQPSNLQASTTPKN